MEATEESPVEATEESSVEATALLAGAQASQSAGVRAESDADGHPFGVRARVRSLAASLWLEAAVGVSRTAALYSHSGGYRRASLVLSLTWFSLALGFYGMSMWLPQYFTQLGVSV